MATTITIQLPSDIATNDIAIKEAIRKKLGKQVQDIFHYKIVKRSIDARSKMIKIILQIEVFSREEKIPAIPPLQYDLVGAAAPHCIIIGAGPAGLFAALRLIELGIKPIVLERGKDVKSRRRDLATLNKEGIVDPDSNYCFGEGGAGTYSDGKLYTRSGKRGSIARILDRFVHFGAAENILYDAHPHIGTNKLPKIITAIREQILASGGEVHFRKKVVDIIVNDSKIEKVLCEGGDYYCAAHYILATGHSAKDIFHLLYKRGISIEQKPFALGVRVEHKQGLIDNIQYGQSSQIEEAEEESKYLPPASYSLVQQIQGTGVYSFCMCPGGIIAPAATEAGLLVVNGWSPSKRNNPYANSGIVVELQKQEVLEYMPEADDNDPLLFLKFQEKVEAGIYKLGGGNFVAPAQRLIDFCKDRLSEDLPANSYIPGLKSARLSEALPPFVYKRLVGAFKAFGKKLKGYYTNEAVVVATESRTSSPVRIPRDKESLEHIHISNLYPCAEGAGYAGGIVSAAIDGEQVAEKIAAKFSSQNKTL